MRPACYPICPCDGFRFHHLGERIIDNLFVQLLTKFIQVGFRNLPCRFLSDLIDAAYNHLIPIVFRKRFVDTADAQIVKLLFTERGKLLQPLLRRFKFTAHLELISLGKVFGHLQITFHLLYQLNRFFAAVIDKNALRFLRHDLVLNRRHDPVDSALLSAERNIIRVIRKKLKPLEASTLHPFHLRQCIQYRIFDRIFQFQISASSKISRETKYLRL